MLLHSTGVGGNPDALESGNAHGGTRSLRSEPRQRALQLSRKMPTLLRCPLDGLQVSRRAWALGDESPADRSLAPKACPDRTGLAPYASPAPGETSDGLEQGVGDHRPRLGPVWHASSLRPRHQRPHQCLHVALAA